MCTLPSLNLLKKYKGIDSGGSDPEVIYASDS